jgi:hypothetical protein
MGMGQRIGMGPKRANRRTGRSPAFWSKAEHLLWARSGEAKSTQPGSCRGTRRPISPRRKVERSLSLTSGGCPCGKS